MQHKSTPLSATDVNTLQSLQRPGRAAPLVYSILAVVMLLTAIMLTAILAQSPGDRGLWIFVLFILAFGIGCMRLASTSKKAKNTYSALLENNEKIVISGLLLRLELTARNTIRYQFDNGAAVEVYPLLAQHNIPGSVSIMRKIEDVKGLAGTQVTLHIALLSQGMGVLLQTGYDDQAVHVAEQPILAEDRKTIMQEVQIIALIFGILLFILFLILGFAGGFSTTMVLIGWLPPAIIIAGGLLIMLIRYWRSIQGATRKIVITGTVTEKITAWGRAGKTPPNTPGTV